MYTYLQGVYRVLDEGQDEVAVIEVGGIGYELLVPPIVHSELGSTCEDGQTLRLYVSAVSSRDQPWPLLFGFLRLEERRFWDLLRTVPRLGGKGAARAMVIPVASIARAIQDGDRALLDGLPGITADGAEKIVASLRKKVGPFLAFEPAADTRGSASAASSSKPRQDAVELLVSMGVKRLDAQKAVDQIVRGGETVSVQDIVTEYLRVYHGGRA